MLSTNWALSCPVADSHCSIVMPWDCSWRTVASTRRCRSLCTSGSGGSMSVSPVSASVTRPTSCWRAWPSLVAEIRSRMLSRHSSTVSCSPRFSATHSSVGSGSTSSCTRETLTTKSAGSSVPFGVGGEASARRPAARPMTCVVEVVGDPALADLVGPVLGVEPGDLLAVAGGDEVERDEVAAPSDGRPASASSPCRRSSAVTASSTSASVASGDGSSTRRPP